MERWNMQQHVTCVRSYYETKSVTEVHCVFRQQFNVVDMVTYCLRIPYWLG